MENDVNSCFADFNNFPIFSEILNVFISFLVSFFVNRNITKTLNENFLIIKQKREKFEKSHFKLHIPLNLSEMNRNVFATKSDTFATTIILF